jgi:hypothetical protein
VPLWASVLCVPFVRLGRWPHDLAAVKAEGFTIVALTPREPASPFIP